MIPISNKPTYVAASQPWKKYDSISASIQLISSAQGVATRKPSKTAIRVGFILSIGIQYPPIIKSIVERGLTADCRRSYLKCHL